MDNIILTGMPGVGKSTVGVILAKEIGYRFLDSDLLIQEREKRLLKEIIAEEGIDGFLKIENQVNASIDAEKTVIATGGSAIYGSGAMRHFKETGRVVYLHLEYDQLKKRLGDLKDRGVVLREGQTLLDIYKEREILYRQYADLVLDETGRDLENTLAELIRQLQLPDRK